MSQGHAQGRRPALDTVEAALARKANFEYEQTTLQAAVKDLAEEYRVSVLIDHPELKSVGISEAVPLTGKAEGRPLGEALRQVLPEDLTLIVRHGAIVVTTRDAARISLETVVYRPLKRFDPDAFMADVTTKVEPQSWEDVGGVGSVAAFSLGAIVISHTPDVQSKVTERYAEFIEPVRTVGPPPRRAVPGRKATIPVALQQATNADFVQTPLDQALASLAEEHGIAIELDEAFASDAAAKTPSTAHLRNLSLASTLTLLTRPAGAAWTAEANRIRILPIEALQAFEKVYNVRDLGDTVELGNTIPLLIGQESWIGGEGVLRPGPGNGQLTVVNKPQIHAAIEKLLEDLRQTKRRR